MPWNYTDEYYREYTRTTWNGVARSYQGFMQRLKPSHRELLRHLDPKPGEEILDLASGAGEPSISIAHAVGERGRVLGVDLSTEMVALSEETARAQGIGNVEFRPMDCEQLDLPSAQYDAVVSAYGFQIFTDPEKAAREAFRVLKPGGRLAVSIWSTGDRVPYLDAIIGPMLKHAEPDENGYIPTPYEIGGEGEMVRFLKEVGFPTAAETRVTQEYRFKDSDEYLDVLLRGTPIGHSLSEEDPAVQKEVLAATVANLRRWATADGIALPGESVYVTAQK